MYESAEKTESDFEERAKENYSSWWRGVQEYYDLMPEEMAYFIASPRRDKLEGIVTFVYGGSMTIRQRLRCRSDHEYVWQMGIPLKTMLNI